MHLTKSTTLLALITAGLVTTALATEPDLSGLSFCLDPGHGPGNANHGPTGVYEHVINLRVALYLRDYLNSAGADTVILTRTNSNPTLSQREDIANRNGVDWFHSIHHNAYNGQHRFTLVLYEELHTSSSSLGPQWPGQADVMSEIMARTIYEGLRTSGWMARGDWSFYGGPNGGWNLGVLNDLTMPGELSEATFHDNPVEEAKLKNPDFLRFEARALYHSFLEYYDAGTIPTGALAGILYDAESNTPLNGATVSLLEAGLQYVTDDNSNGYYAWDGLEPGTYTLVASRKDYDPDTTVVVVPEDTFTFRDFRLTSNVPPLVLATSPTPGAEGVPVTSDVRIKFSRPMNRPSVEAAFSISPTVNGSFYWLNQGRVLRFKPDGLLQYGTLYQVTVDTTARDLGGRAIDGNGDGVAGDPFALVFETASRENSRARLFWNWPADGDTMPSPNGVVSAAFNKVLDSATVTLDAFNVIDVLRHAVAGSLVLDVYGDSSTVAFVPTEGFEPGGRFIARAFTTLRDTTGLPVQENTVWRFRVADENFVLRTFDDFEYLTNWHDPEWSGSTSGTVPESTSFEISTEHVLFGEGAARLKYQFADTSGFIRVFFDDIHDPLATPGKFGPSDVLEVYIFGDGSGNEFRFCLDDNESGYEVSRWIPINWIGWRLVTFDVKRDSVYGWITGNGRIDGPNLDVDSFHFRCRGRLRGAIYLDRLMVARRLPTGVATAFSSLPLRFALSPGYPNPFNPSVQWTLSVPGREARNVQVAVFDVRGRLVRMVADKTFTPGQHLLRWNGKDNAGRNLPSGVYVVRAKLGDEVRIQKVTLAK